MTPEGHIGLTSFYAVTSLAFVIFRFWALRVYRRSRTTLASNISSVSIVIAEFTFVVCAIVNIWLLTRVIADREQGLKLVPGLDVSLRNAIPELKTLYFDRLAYYTMLWSVKGGFLGLYFDMSSNMKSGIRWVLYATCVFTLLTYLINFLISALWCMPIDRSWFVSPLSPHSTVYTS